MSSSKKFKFIASVELKPKNTLKPGKTLTSIESEKGKGKRTEQGQKNGDKYQFVHSKKVKTKVITGLQSVTFRTLKSFTNLSITVVSNNS